MISYNNVIELLQTRIPDYKIDQSFADNPVVAFSLFSNYISEAYQSSDNLKLNKCINLVNELSENNDSDIRVLLDEIAIGLYDEAHNLYYDFKQQISKEAAALFDSTITKWKNQQ